MKTQFLLSLMVLSTPFMFAQTGSLDNTFDSDGKVTTDVGGFDLWDFGKDVAVQADGKIIVVGEVTDFATFTYGIGVCRYNTNGSLDNTFSSDGKVITHITSGDDRAESVVIQTDGKIVIAGRANGDFALARYNTNGSLDNTFGSSGKVTTDFLGDYDEAKTIKIQSDGKFVVAGSAWSSGIGYLAVARYNSDGSLDNTFNSTGKDTITQGGAMTNVIDADIEIQADGKILVTATGPNTDYFQIVRYNTNGSLDNTFGTGGVANAVFPVSGSIDLQTIAIQPDGKIVVAGDVETYPASDYTIVRYNTDGSLDNTFGTVGQVVIDVANWDVVPSIILQPDSKILIAGNSGTADVTDYDFTLIRCNADGSLDNSFGSGGIVTTDVKFGGNDYAEAVVLQPNGSIVVAGTVDKGTNPNFDFAIVRYLNDLSVGVLDFSQKDNAITVYPNPIHHETTLEYSLEKEEIITISLYDISGKLVSTLVSNEKREKGAHQETLVFNEAIPSGNYFLKINNISIKILKR